jgi:hypothetical protein
MATYTTVEYVGEELNGFDIDSTTTPDISTVNNWIEEESAYIDLRTNQVWGSSTASSEIYDYDGSGIITLRHKPVLSITELKEEENGINGTSESWVELTEGRTNSEDFYVYSSEGDIIFHGTNMPKAGYQKICVSYTYGRTTTPINIQKLATKLVALRVINSVINGSASEEGGSVSVGTITVSDPSTFGITRVREMRQEIESLFNSIGKLKVYALDRRY